MTGTLRSDFSSDTKAVRIKDRGWPEASRRVDKFAYPRYVNLVD
jgi:hypothetical protein